ncbi:MAG: DnaB-like helicase C-terminal domain-containing protein [Acidimicrobiia bacterium]|nr:DnaB-like helicase C-terminal domain-containing protein [Acidimicrobiia bacterium]
MSIKTELPDGSLQENLLTLLCFDPEHAPVIDSVVDVELFGGSVFSDVAHRASQFLQQFKEPAAEHLPDLFHDILYGKDDKQAALYARVFENMAQVYDTINAGYVMSRLSGFVRRQKLTGTVVKAAQTLQLGTEEAIAETEMILSKGLRFGVQEFDAGAFLYSEESFQAITQADLFFPTLIEPLDNVGMAPAPGTLLTFMSLPNKGKSWFLTHIGKVCAAVHRLRVVHISLEMGREKQLRRYWQAYLSMPRSHPEVVYPRLLMEEGDFSGVKRERMNRLPIISTKGSKLLRKRSQALRKSQQQILVKQFPTNSLTTLELSAWLDQLERTTRFVPDVLLVDYADIMKISAGAVRQDTSAVYKDLRGLAVDRNMAVVTCSQSNRSGEDARMLTFKHFAEDYSKAATSDYVITYSQTPQEHKLGLARLFNAKNRDEEAMGTTLISQAYAAGQFVVDAYPLPSDYLDVLEDMRGRDLEE